MSKNRGKTPPPKQGKKAAPAVRPAPAPEVQPISPLGLVGAIGAALVIAAILLYVINARTNAAKQPPVVAVPTAAVRPATATPIGAAPTIAAATPATQPTTAGVTLVGGFSKGNAQAKVTFTEFGDYK